MSVRKIVTPWILIPTSGILILLLNMPAVELRNAFPPTACDIVKRLALAYVWIFYSYGIGACILDNFKCEESQDVPLPQVLFVGFTALTVSVYVLSCLALFKSSIVLPLFCITSFSVYRGQKDFAMRLARGFREEYRSLFRSSIATKAMMLPAYCVMLCIIIFIIIYKAVYPDFGGDIFCYYRYYQMVVDQASIIPKAFDGWVYFPAKGSGLHSLCALLTGSQTLPIASLVYYTFLIFLSISLMSLVTTKRYWHFILVASLSLNMEMVIFTNNFSKTNLYAAIHPFFLLYILIFIEKYHASKVSYAALAAYCVSSAFFTIQTSAFSFLLLIAVAYPLRRSGPGIYKVLLACALGLLFFSGMMSFINLFQVSFADLSTVIPQIKAHLYIASTYLSCKVEFDTLSSMTLMQTGNVKVTSYLKNAWGLLSSTGFLGSRFFDFAWFGLLFALRPTKPFADCDLAQKFIQHFVLIFFVAFLLYAAVFSSFNSEYMRKHSIIMFGIMYKCVLYTMSFYLISEHITPFVLRTFSICRSYPQGIDAFVKIAIFIVVVATSVYVIPYNIKDDLRDRLEYLSGKMQPKDVYLRYYPEIIVCDAVLEYLEKNHLDGKVWPIGVPSSVSAYSHGRLVDENDVGLQVYIRQIFYSDPHDSIQAMSNLGIFYVVLDFRDTVRYLSLAPVFSPESLQRNFRILTQINDSAWLLTLDTSEGKPLTCEFISQYKQYLTAKAGVAVHSQYDGLATFLSRCVIQPL